jgi:hypothetical protein
MTTRTAEMRAGLLERLQGPQRTPCVSIHLPVSSKGFDRSRDGIVLKNLVKEARERLETQGHDADLLAGVEDTDLRGLTRRSRGEAVYAFRAPGLSEVAVLPELTEARVRVGRAFAFRPLLAWSKRQDRFWLLVLDANEVGLWRGTQAALQRVEVPDLPADRAKALWSDDPEEALQYHSKMPGRGKTRAAMFHGQGEASDEQKVRLERFFHHVDEAVAPVLKKDPAPLVLASVEYYRPIYERVDSSGLGVAALAAGSPDASDERALHAAALKALGERHGGPASVLERYEALAAKRSDHTSDDVADVIEGARQGLVDTLVVTRDATQWGLADGEGAPRRCGAGEPRAEDLIDLAVYEALKTGASVHVAGANDMPNDADVLGIWRVPRQPA